MTYCNIVLKQFLIRSVLLHKGFWRNNSNNCNIYSCWISLWNLETDWDQCFSVNKSHSPLSKFVTNTFFLLTFQYFKILEGADDTSGDLLETWKIIVKQIKRPWSLILFLSRELLIITIETIWVEKKKLLDIKHCIISGFRGRRSGEGAPPLLPFPFFAKTCFFAITLKNYKLCWLKLNWSLTMHLWNAFTQNYQNIFNTQSFVIWQTVIMLF